MLYYLYKITNILNNRIYVGVHQTENINDGYMGSGKMIQRAIKKYGKDNFKKEILEFFDNKEEMYAKEAEVVNETFLKSVDCYNVALGGGGGSIEENRKPFVGPHSEKSKEKIGAALRGKTHTENTKLKMREHNWARTNPAQQKLHAMEAGKKRWIASSSHLTETKQKISSSIKCLNETRLKNNEPHPNLGIKRQKIICPFCLKQGAKNTMFRFHFEKCKQR